MKILQTLSLSWLTLLVALVTQLVQIPLALHYLSREEFGIYAVFAQLLGYLFICDFGASPALMRLLVDGRTQGDAAFARTWASGHALLMAQGALMMAVVLAAGPAVPSLFSVPSELACHATLIFWSLGLVAALKQATLIYSLTMWATQRVVAANAFQLAAGLIQFAIFVATIGPFGLWAYVASAAVGQLSPHLYYAWVCHRNGLTGQLSRRNIRGSDIRTVFSLGLDAMALSVFHIVVNSSILVIAGLVMPLQQVAVLSVNLKPVQLFAEVLRRIHQSAEPYLAHLISSGDLGRFRFGWGLASKVILTVGAAGAAAFILCGPWLITVWTSAEFLLPPLSMVLLAFVALRSSLHGLCTNSLFLFKELKRIRFHLLAETVLYIALAIWLGRLHGAAGLLAAYLVTFLAGSFPPALRQLAGLAGLTWTNGLRGLVSLAAMLIVPVAAALAFQGALAQIDPAWQLAAAALSGILCCGLALSVLNPDERRYAMQFAARKTPVAS